jgi:hypothetical protein
MKRKSRRKSAKVYTLPHIERRDLAPGLAPARVVLEGAIEKGVINVVLVGIDRRGELYVAGSYRNVDEAVGVLMRGVQLVAGGRVGLLHGEIYDTAKDTT